ncbi:MAG: mechanosensitive ion channel protein MscS, small conductance mechanosensitive channel [Candidatus Saccharibacteria bacterium]|nr:mechanosensitive ion channel protein MscS, small conductance mechanosensitive channel [Candidatus Saccharibacteria bacterium]
MNEVFHWFTTYGNSIVVIVIISAGFYYVGSMFMERIIMRALHTTKHNWSEKDIQKRQRTLSALFKNIWRALVLAIGTFALFHLFFKDVSLAPLFASAGIIGVAFGFGAQSLVQDFLSGLFIISENQYRVGDIIDIEGASGTVERIGARSTVIRDADGNVHYFPNGMIKHVVNKTMDYSMARFSINVHPSSDLDDVITIINDTGKKLADEAKWKSKIIEAPSFVSIGEFTANSVSMLISAKTQPSDQWGVTAEMRRRLLSELEKNKIQLSSMLPIAQQPAKK